VEERSGKDKTLAGKIRAWKNLLYVND